MLAQQPASRTPCHRHRVDTTSLHCSLTSSWHSQQTTWHPPQCLQLSRGLQLLQHAHGHAQHSFKACCHTGQQATTITKASNPTVEVISYKRDPSKAEACVQAIASAMVADPSTAYFCRDGKQFYVSILRLLLRLYPTSPQLVISSDGQGTSAALCYAMPRLEPIWWPALFSWDLLAAIAAVKPLVIVDGLRGADFYESRRNAFIQEHGGCVLYLLAIGTDPQHQGRGLGSAVLAALTSLADRQQVPMYLEATTSRSVALYERHGFVPMGTQSSKPRAPPVTFMSRLPRRLPDQTSLLSNDSSTSESMDSSGHERLGWHDGEGHGVWVGKGEGQGQGATGVGAGRQLGRGLFSQYPMNSRSEGDQGLPRHDSDDAH